MIHCWDLFVGRGLRYTFSHSVNSLSGVSAFLLYSTFDLFLLSAMFSCTTLGHASFVGFLWSIAFLPHTWRHTLRKQPLTGRFWAAMLKAHNSEQNNFFKWEKTQQSTKKTSNINVRVLSINLKNGYFLPQFSFKVNVEFCSSPHRFSSVA